MKGVSGHVWSFSEGCWVPVLAAVYPALAGAFNGYLCRVAKSSDSLRRAK